jgi:hypothetical protein
VLFWGRRVYWGAVVLVVTALRQGRVVGITAQRLQALFGVTRPTLTRWLRYFRAVFPHTPTWRRLVGRLGPPGRPAELIGDLLAHFVRARGDPEHGLITCLVALGGGGR